MMFIDFMKATGTEVDCPECTRSFDTTRGMRTHYGHSHDAPAPWKDVLTCDNCGTEYQRPQARQKDSDSTYCSNECRFAGETSDVPNFHLEYGGEHPKVTTRDKLVPIHHLVAIAEGADPSKVFGRNRWSVDHRNGCKIDNRPENLQLLTLEEHADKDAGRKAEQFTYEDMLRVVEWFVRPDRRDGEA